MGDLAWDKAACPHGTAASGRGPRRLQPDGAAAARLPCLEAVTSEPPLHRAPLPPPGGARWMRSSEEPVWALDLPTQLPLRPAPRPPTRGHAQAP